MKIASLEVRLDKGCYKRLRYERFRRVARSVRGFRSLLAKIVVHWVALAATRHLRDRRGMRYLGEFLGIIGRMNEGRRNKEGKASDRRNGTLCGGNGRKGHRGCLGLSSIGSRFVLYTGEKRRSISGQLTTETGIYRGYDFLCSRFFSLFFSTRMITASSTASKINNLLSRLARIENVFSKNKKKNETSSVRVSHNDLHNDLFRSISIINFIIRNCRTGSK